MLKLILRARTLPVNLLRSFSTSSVVRLKEIIERKEGDTLIIEGKLYKSLREPYLLKLDKESNKCALCQLQLDLKHTDVLILSQFIDSQGNIMQQKDTYLCKDQYKLVKELIYMAQYAGLLPEPPRKEPRRPYEKLNTYFDEATINLRPRRKLYGNKLNYLQLGPIEKRRIKPERGCHYFNY